MFRPHADDHHGKFVRRVFKTAEERDLFVKI